MQHTALCHQWYLTLDTLEAIMKKMEIKGTVGQKQEFLDEIHRRSRRKRAKNQSKENPGHDMHET